MLIQEECYAEWEICWGPSERALEAKQVHSCLSKDVWEDLAGMVCVSAVILMSVKQLSEWPGKFSS